MALISSIFKILRVRERCSPAAETARSVGTCVELRHLAARATGHAQSTMHRVERPRRAMPDMAGARSSDLRTELRRTRLISAPCNAALTLDNYKPPFVLPRSPKGASGDSSLPTLTQSTLLSRSPVRYDAGSLQPTGAPHPHLRFSFCLGLTARSATQVLSRPRPRHRPSTSSRERLCRRRMRCAQLPLIHACSSLPTSDSALTWQAHVTRLENVRPWALRQWSQKSLWPRPPSASLNMSPSGNELIPGQPQPDEAPAPDATQAYVGGGHYEAHPPPAPSYPIDVLAGASDAGSPDDVDDGNAFGSGGAGGRSMRVCGRIRTNANGVSTEASGDPEPARGGAAAGGGSLRTLVISGSVRATPFSRTSLSLPPRHQPPRGEK